MHRLAFARLILGLTKLNIQWFGNGRRPLRGLDSFLGPLSWGSRPRLYADARFRGLVSQLHDYRSTGFPFS